MFFALVENRIVGKRDQRGRLVMVVPPRRVARGEAEGRRRGGSEARERARRRPQSCAAAKTAAFANAFRFRHGKAADALTERQRKSLPVVLRSSIGLEERKIHEHPRLNQ